MYSFIKNVASEVNTNKSRLITNEITKNEENESILYIIVWKETDISIFVNCLYKSFQHNLVAVFVDFSFYFSITAI